MDWKVFATTFGLVFLAEMGDKTQLAAISMVGKTGKTWAVFLGASIALVCVTLVGVLFGAALVKAIPEKVLHKIAAGAFVAIGLWMFFAGE